MEIFICPRCNLQSSVDIDNLKIDEYLVKKAEEAKIKQKIVSDQLDEITQKHRDNQLSEYEKLAFVRIFLDLFNAIQYFNEIINKITTYFICEHCGYKKYFKKKEITE